VYPGTVIIVSNLSFALDPNEKGSRDIQDSIFRNTRFGSLLHPHVRPRVLRTQNPSKKLIYQNNFIIEDQLRE